MFSVFQSKIGVFMGFQPITKNSSKMEIKTVIHKNERILFTYAFILLLAGIISSAVFVARYLLFGSSGYVHAFLTIIALYGATFLHPAVPYRFGEMIVQGLMEFIITK